MVDGAKPDFERLEARELTLGEELVTGKVTLATYNETRAVQETSGTLVSRTTKGTETPTRVEFSSVPAGGKDSAAKVLAAEIQAKESTLSGNCYHPALYVGQALKIADAADAAMKGDFVVSEIEWRCNR